jgi:putative ABC transport system substrate-binding protein
MLELKRRQFFTLLGGAAAAWPLAARAQQGERVRRVGALMNLTADDLEASARVTALAQGLQQLGWTVGRNLRIDYRWGAIDADRAPKDLGHVGAIGHQTAAHGKKKRNG